MGMCLSPRIASARGNMRSLHCQEDSEQLFGLGAVIAPALKLSEQQGGACASECNARQWKPDDRLTLLEVRVAGHGGTAQGNQLCLGVSGNDARAPEGRCRPMQKASFTRLRTQRLHHQEQR